MPTRFDFIIKIFFRIPSHPTSLFLMYKNVIQDKIVKNSLHSCQIIAWSIYLPKISPIIQ
jgi:hypothetical protein